MCGVLLMFGPAAQQRIAGCLARLSHRGPDEQHLYHDGFLSMGFARLAINDMTPAGRQPLQFNQLIGAINGEIFNASELQQEFSISLDSTNDCHIVPALFGRFEPHELLAKLDGFYAGVVYNSTTRQVFTLRDYIGKKPLFSGRSGSEIFITSELRAVDGIDGFCEVESGICEINLVNGNCQQIAKHEPTVLSPDLGDKTHTTSYDLLRSVLRQAVMKRLPENKGVGIFLSGGLDSSVIASIAASYRSDIHYYCLADSQSTDYPFMRSLIASLGLSQVTFLALPTTGELEELISAVVFATHSFNPSIISNGICTYMLARAARADGLRVVLSGEGADELLGGYHSPKASDTWQATRAKLVADMRFTELRRVDLTSMAHGIEVRCPFLDRAVFDLAMSFNIADIFKSKSGSLFNKWVLRKAFEHDLPEEIIWRSKTSGDVGSGLRGRVVNYLRATGLSERSALKNIWDGHFKASFSSSEAEMANYFDAYPVFDAAIDRRGTVHR